jgi:hypothetical protein
MNLLSLVSNPTKDQINTAAGANLKNVTRWSSPVAVNSKGLGAAVTVAHDLGTLPNRIAVEPYIDSRWWADQDDRRAWSASSVVFHTSHAGVFIVRVGLQ